MRKILREIADHPQEIFDYFVYFVGLYVVRVLVEDGHRVVAILQGILWVGYMYSCHRRSLREENHADTVAKLQQKQAYCDDLARQRNAAYELLTDEQLSAYFDTIYRRNK